MKCAGCKTEVAATCVWIGNSGILTCPSCLELLRRTGRIEQATREAHLWYIKSKTQAK